ncbi:MULTISPECIES: hypothetical protein [Spirulina sp. CCY15215]|uniref:hypothetical protein n=1 Tax=Spirulina sp. CCY15215 TaxID=2767591 RepID=UPI00194FC4A4|nr:hypothetical protein [Spirulina major]
MINLYQYHNDKNRLRQEIDSQKKSIKVPNFIPKNDKELVDTYQSCRVLDFYLIEYFKNNAKTKKLTEKQEEIVEIISLFKQEVWLGLSQEKEKFRKNIQNKKTGFKNIFEFSGSENLYLSNIYTRFISENLGHKFENIAEISDSIFIPENTLNLKIKGIDLVLYDGHNIRYTQLKTKKDTLTGSQSQRSINELKIHQNPIFAAALDMGKSWTISKTKAQQSGIQLLAGSEFWSLIGLDYGFILDQLSDAIKDIDKQLYR